MDVDEFTWKTRVSQTELTRILGGQHNSLYKIKLREQSASMLLACKLIEISDGNIKPEDLLSVSDQQKLAEWRAWVEKHIGGKDAYPKFPANL